MKLLKIISVLLLLYSFMATEDVFAATLTVTKSADTADSVCDADCSLREAVVAANSGDVIVFAPLFNSPQTITLTGGQITIDKNLTIAETGVDLLTVSANNAGRIFYISDNAVVALSGMKLTGGLLTTSNPSGGAIYLTDSTLTLTNMTLTGNSVRFIVDDPFSIGSGGAIYSYNSTMTIINSTIDKNFAPSGSGVSSTFGTINVANSTIANNSSGVSSRNGTVLTNFNGLINVVNSVFSGNSGRAVAGTNLILTNTIVANNIGGGIAGSAISINRCNISDNDSISGEGGGVYSDGIASISNTVINNNKGYLEGGGIYNRGNMSISNSTISNNTTAVGSGGGISNIGSLKLINSTVSGNSTTYLYGMGGGIYNSANGNAILTNVTIASNRANGNGGGLRQDNTGLLGSTGTVTFSNTIIAGNLSNNGAADVSGTVVSQGFNLIGDAAGSSGWISSDLLNRNPLLAPLGNNGGLTLTHALMPGSPAINAGSNALAIDSPNNSLQFDQRGAGYVRRAGVVMGNAVTDIGAYEFNPANSPVTLSGRVFTMDGRGISNARITLTDSNGTVIYAQTNPFGYYRFVNLPPGTTYIINLMAKRYQFNSPQVITIDRNRDDLNFIASLTR